MKAEGEVLVRVELMCEGKGRLVYVENNGARG